MVIAGLTLFLRVCTESLLPEILVENDTILITFIELTNDLCQMFNSMMAKTGRQASGTTALLHFW